MSSLSPILFTLLPGPTRKRVDTTYCYRLTYHNPNDTNFGCVMTWEITGGRLTYQIAVEREETGTLRLHCTCADAVYRGEEEGHTCKHVRALLAFGTPCVTLPLLTPAAVPVGEAA